MQYDLHFLIIFLIQKPSMLFFQSSVQKSETLTPVTSLGRNFFPPTPIDIVFAFSQHSYEHGTLWERL